MQTKKVTMKDIAQELDVSIVTVSKALADKEGVGDELREQIKEKANQLGYIFKKSQANERAERRVAIVIAERYVGGVSFYVNVYQKLLFELTHRKMLGVLEVIREGDERSGDLSGLISLDSVQQLIVLGETDKNFLESLEKTRKDVILFDFENEDFDFDAVVGDNVNGGYLMTRYLYKQGFDKIGFVGNFRSTRSILDRFLGYRKYHIMKNLEYNPSYLVLDRTDEGKIIDIELPDELPQAFVCNCDTSAHRLIDKLKEEGFRVPEDIAVVGYDDYDAISGRDYNITTYRVNIQEMIYHCINMIEQKYENPDYRNGTTVSYGRVIERETGLKK
ncbi:MAG: LacI family DNA-binding transcriptional regulator [Eubacterium sp.]|nr:LacI family DNA-binding transcriptional regulator [Eubacterium sp.]